MRQWARYSYLQIAEIKNEWMRQWDRYSYLQIAEIKNEWMRQWARTVLIVERTIPPAERLKQQNRFHLFFFFFYNNNIIKFLCT